MTKNLVLTYACGPVINDIGFHVFIRSALRNIPFVKVVVLSPDEKIDEVLAQYNNLQLSSVQITPSRDGQIFRDRHLAYWEFLNKNRNKFDNVVLTDCRDVVFQSDPFAWYKNFNLTNLHERQIVFSCEGFARSTSNFATLEHIEFQRDVPLPYMKSDDWIVCNAGVYMGNVDFLIQFELMFFFTCMKSIGRCTDQASLNYMLQYLSHQNEYEIISPKTPFCLTGEGVKQGAVPFFDDNGVAKTQKCEIYSIVHQWDRIAKFSDSVLEMYGC